MGSDRYLISFRSKQWKVAWASWHMTWLAFQIKCVDVCISKHVFRYKRVHYSARHDDRKVCIFSPCPLVIYPALCTFPCAKRVCTVRMPSSHWAKRMSTISVDTSPTTCVLAYRGPPLKCCQSSWIVRLISKDGFE